MPRVKIEGNPTLDRHRETNRAWLERNPEYKDKIRKYAKEWRKRNKERIKEYNLNRDRKSENYKKYNKEYQRKYQRKYNEKYKVYRMRARARRQILMEDNIISPHEINERLKITGYSCVYCGKKRYEQIDHVIALSRGGKNHIKNLVPACTKCNRSKQASEWKD